MTTPEQPSAQPLDATTRGHMPYASWMVGGVFRFDRHLLLQLAFLATYYPPRALACAAGVLPCAWSLERYGLSPMVSAARYRAVLEAYARQRVGLVLVFDNPAPAPESLHDEVLLTMVQDLMLAEFNPTGRNAVCVAHDELAALLRARFPRLPIICHPNRLLLATEKRTPEFYEELEHRYNRIILHPRDAVTPALYTKLRHVGRYAVVVNDPTPRNSATRRDVLNVLSELRRRPWDNALLRTRDRLLRQAQGDMTAKACNLTRQEELALYEAGIRSFVVQASLFRNEMTLWWDLYHHLLRTLPEHSNKAALIVSAAMAHIREDIEELPSGLGLFSTVDE